MVALVIAAAVIALLAFTAIASRQPLSGVGQALPPPGPGRSQINAPPWALVLAGAGVLVALLGLVASVSWRLPRRQEEDEAAPRRVIVIPRAAKLLALLAPVVLGAVLIAAAIAGSHARTPIVPPKGRVAPPPHAPVPRGSSYDAPGWIVPSVIGVVIGGAGAVLLTLAVRGRLEARTEPGAAVARAEELRGVVAASLDDLRSEPDPRRAVIAAYRRMEAALADAGLPRRAWEAPREYSGRAHTHLELSGRPLRQLTSLFERARFGPGSVGEPLREQAIASLSALQQELAALTRQETLT